MLELRRAVDSETTAVAAIDGFVSAAMRPITVAVRTSLQEELTAAAVVASAVAVIEVAVRDLVWMIVVASGVAEEFVVVNA